MIIRYFLCLKSNKHIEIDKDTFEKWYFWNKENLKLDYYINDTPIEIYIKKEEFKLTWIWYQSKTSNANFWDYF